MSRPNSTPATPPIFPAQRPPNIQPSHSYMIPPQPRGPFPLQPPFPFQQHSSDQQYPHQGQHQFDQPMGPHPPPHLQHQQLPFVPPQPFFRPNMMGPPPPVQQPQVYGPVPSRMPQFHSIPPPSRPIVLSRPPAWQPPPASITSPTTQMSASLSSTSLNTTPEQRLSPQASSAQAKSDLTAVKFSIKENSPSATRPTPSGLTSSGSIDPTHQTESSDQENAEGKKKLDLYASIYVPAWLLEVNQDDAYFQVPHQAPPLFDHVSYASRFLTKHILENSEPIEDEAESEDEGSCAQISDQSHIHTERQNVNAAFNESNQSPNVTSPTVTYSQAQHTNRTQASLHHNGQSGMGSIGLPRQSTSNDNVNDQAVKNRTKLHQRDTKRKEAGDFTFSDERDFDPTLSSASSSSSYSSPADAGWITASERLSKSSVLDAPSSDADWGPGPTPSIGAIAQVPKSYEGLGIPALESETISVLQQLESLPQSNSSAPLSAQSGDKTIDYNRFPPLEATTYCERFEKLLTLEVDSRIEDLSRQSLFEVGLQRYGTDKSLGLWTLSLPGIREERPRLIPGDRVELRALASISKSWLKLSFDAHITSVRAVEGRVVLECRELENTLRDYYPKVEDAKFNVIFHPILKIESDALESLKYLQPALRRGHRVGNVLKRWLFPSIEHSRADSTKTKFKEAPIQYFDQRLNSEQRDAVEKISTRKHSIPYLISGPPGTGKTKTITEATLQVLQTQPHSTILLVAPSNTAADTLALRLSEALRPADMVRINDASRTFAEVPQQLMLFCPIDQEKSTFCLPDFKKLMKARVVVITTFDAALLVKARVTNSDLGKLNAAVLPAIKSRALAEGQDSQIHDRDIPLHFTHLIVDETGQGTEAELASVFAVMLPSRYSDRESDPVIVFCGDHNQLGPRVQSHEARSNGLDISILERLWQRPVYSSAMKRLREGRRKSTLKSLKAETNSNHGIWSHEIDRIVQRENVCAHLVQNYRARHPSLLMVASSLFYNDTLRPADLRSSELRNWSGLPAKGFPLVFEGVEGEDKWVDEGVSWHSKYHDHNALHFLIQSGYVPSDEQLCIRSIYPQSDPAEVRKVVQLIQSLTGIYRDPDGWTIEEASPHHQWVSPKDIAVISPFREQVWRLRLALRKRGFSAISVGTTEVFQGAEHAVTIVSTVRSRERFLKDDMKNNLGLMFERKRFCVATTRAKELMIVVGNGNLLKKDPYWRSFLELVIRKKSFNGPAIDGIDLLSASDVSALEVLYADEMHYEDDGKAITEKSEEARHEEKVQQTAGRVVATALEDTEEEW